MTVEMLFKSNAKPTTWTEADDSLILLLDELGMSPEAIADSLSYRGSKVRTPFQITLRLRQLIGSRLDIQFTLQR